MPLATVCNTHTRQGASTMRKLIFVVMGIAIMGCQTTGDVNTANNDALSESNTNQKTGLSQSTTKSVPTIKGTWCGYSGPSIFSAPEDGKLELCRNGRCYTHKYVAQDEARFTLEYQGKRAYFILRDQNTLERERVIRLSNGARINRDFMVSHRC